MFLQVTSLKKNKNKNEIIAHFLPNFIWFGDIL